MEDGTSMNWNKIYNKDINTPESENFSSPGLNLNVHNFSIDSNLKKIGSEHNQITSKAKKNKTSQPNTPMGSKMFSDAIDHKFKDFGEHLQENSSKGKKRKSKEGVVKKLKKEFINESY